MTQDGLQTPRVCLIAIHNMNLSFCKLQITLYRRSRPEQALNSRIGRGGGTFWHLSKKSQHKKKNIFIFLLQYANVHIFSPFPLLLEPNQDGQCSNRQTDRQAHIYTDRHTRSPLVSLS